LGKGSDWVARDADVLDRALLSKVRAGVAEIRGREGAASEGDAWRAGVLAALEKILDRLEGDRGAKVQPVYAEHLVRRRIGDLEAQLNPRNFVRIHRSAIVNLSAVSRMVPWFSGGYLVHLDSGKELKLSRSYATRLFDRVGTAL
jgi:hypothetical protein